MQIALITETYAPEINGVAMTLGHLVEGLAERGHRLWIIRPRQRAENGTEATGHDGRVSQLLVPGLPIPGYPQLRFGLPAGRELSRLWRRDRPDLVHIATEGPLGYSALRAARALRLPVTSGFHTNFHQYTRDYRFSFLFPVAARWLRFFHNRTLRTFAPTQELCRELAAADYRNLRVLSRGIDQLRFNPGQRREELRRSWGADPGDPVIIHAGRLAREKNLPLVFRAFAAMRSANPRCRLVVVGDGPLRASLQAAHPDCLFTGFIDRESLSRHYASGDIYLHASTTETYGNVVAEALASGLAFAGYDYAAAHELVLPGQNGLLVPPGDEAAFLTAARRLATTPELTGRLRAKAGNIVNSRSWPRLVAQFETDLAAAVAEHGAPGHPDRPAKGKPEPAASPL